jgi:hypothetical protein
LNEPRSPGSSFHCWTSQQWHPSGCNSRRELATVGGPPGARPRRGRGRGIAGCLRRGRSCRRVRGRAGLPRVGQWHEQRNATTDCTDCTDRIYGGGSDLLMFRLAIECVVWHAVVLVGMFRLCFTCLRGRRHGTRVRLEFRASISPIRVIREIRGQRR